MGKDSKISWTDSTFNPWWGCTKISEGCFNCYAATFAKRTGLEWGPKADRRFFTDKHWGEPVKWNLAAAKAGKQNRVFCSSMADVFEDRFQLDSHRSRLFRLIHLTPYLDWLLLTKRPENVVRMLPPDWNLNCQPNVWFGTSVENQYAAQKRIPELLAIKAAVRFLSVEPMLGPIDLSPYLINATDLGQDHQFSDRMGVHGRIHWVICGGESGPGARPMDLAWARSLRDQCKAAGVAFFFKQLGGVRDKGGDLESIPEDLRIREFPK